MALSPAVVRARPEPCAPAKDRSPGDRPFMRIRPESGSGKAGAVVGGVQAGEDRPEQRLVLLDQVEVAAGQDVQPEAA